MDEPIGPLLRDSQLVVPCEEAQISNQTTVSPPAVFFHDNGTPQVEDRKKDSRVCRCAGPLASWWKLSATSMYQYQPTIETRAAATTGPETSSMKLMQRRMWLRCSREHRSPLAYLATRWMPVPLVDWDLPMGFAVIGSEGECLEAVRRLLPHTSLEVCSDRSSLLVSDALSAICFKS